MILLLALPSLCRTQAPDWTRVHETTIRGIHHLYDLEIDSAVAAFDSVTAMAPGDPRGPFFSSIVHFYLYGLNRDERELQTFLDQSEKVIAICEHLLDRNDDNARVKFYLGGIYGYRGLAYHGSGSYLKAARDGREGYLLLEQAVREDPNLYDAQMGFGLFRYLLAKLPKSMRWILGVLGFEGDLEGGLHSLRLAGEKGTYTRTEAKLYLAQFLFSEGRRDTALQYLNELRAEYPENTLFTVLYAFWQHRMHNLDEAMKAAQAAIALNAKKKVQYGEELAYSTLGSVYYSLNQFGEAAKYYALYMKMTPHDERTPNYTMYRAGVASEIAGDRQQAVSYYRRMKEADEDHAWDARYYRLGRERLQHPITEGDVLLIKADNEESQNNHQRAIEYYRQALNTSGGDVDMHMKALYGIQGSELDAEMLTEAEETSRRLLALSPATETWILPHAWYRLGQIYVKLGKSADAREAFEKVEEFDGYDSQDRLEERVKDQLASLDQQQERSSP